MTAHLNRRLLLKRTLGASVGLVATSFLTTACGTTAMPAAASAPLQEQVITDSAQALKALLDGNARYVASHENHPHQTADRRIAVSKGQKPFAVVLGCADSRCPPEMIFDQGLGDLFVVRVAGNIASPDILGSIEFAIAEFSTPLIFVLGHESCGAVKATIEALEHGSTAPGSIPTLVQSIAPAVEKVKEQTGDKVDNAVKANVSLVLEQLRTSGPILPAALKSGKLKIVGGRYDLDRGAVELVD